MQISIPELRFLLRCASLSIKELARLCDVTTMAVRYWCNGQRRIPGWLPVLLIRPPDLAKPELPKMTWYETLAVDPKCDFATMRRAYHMLAKQYHPDRMGAKYTAVFQRIQHAYDEGDDTFLDTNITKTKKETT